MPNLLQTGAKWLAGQIQAQASVMAYFVRGEDFICIPVTLGSQLLRTSDNKGNVKTERTERDFIVTAELLTFDDGVTFLKPERGDKWILDVDGNGFKQYNVMPIGSEAPWRWSDPFHTIIRMHSKFIGPALIPVLDNNYAGSTIQYAGSTTDYAGAT